MNASAGTPSILSVQRVRKSFGGIRAVDDCSLSINAQSITGLIGPNGAGKSTLFNIIAGLYRPDAGAIWLAGRRIDGLPPYEIVHRGLTKTCGLANEHAKALSGGQKKLLELARALMTDPAIVLLDEPVAGVNPRLAGNLMDLIERLRRGGRTFFLIEHDMNVVMNRCDRVIVMHQGNAIAEGTPASVKANPLVIESYLGG